MRIFSFIRLFLLLLLLQSFIKAAICENTFAGPVATLDGGELKLQEDTKLINTYNHTVYTDNLDDNDGTCDGQSCNESGDVADSLAYTIDLGDESDGTLNVTSDATISSDKNYEEVKVETDTTLTLQGNITMRVKNTLTNNNTKLIIDGNVTLYVEKFEIKKDASIEVKENASLIIYVKEDFKADENTNIDTHGHPEHFIVLSKNIEIHDNGGIYEGFFYGKEDVKIGEKAQITGAVTGKKVEIKEDTQITYDEDATRNLAIDGVCSVLKPTAEYRFDSCTWDGGTGEVIDQTDNFNATDMNGTTLTDGKINHAAHFDGTDDYIELPDINTDFSNGIAISAWVKFETSGSYQKIIEITDGRNIHGIGLGRSKSSNQITFEIFNDEDYEGVTTDDDVIDGNLHHYVATLHSDGAAKIYVDGEEKGSATFDFLPANVTRKVNYIAKSTWEGDGDDYFGGDIDELKIFNVGLTESQIQEIYTNEKNHKNYDGSHRMAIDCTAPELLAEYRFDACKYTGASGEVIDSAEGDNNGTITGDVTISKNVKKVGHALHLNGGAVDINNLAVNLDIYKKNTVMFWMYWDGTSSIMPFGWNKHDLWMASGYFGFNTAHNDIYGISSNGLAKGWHHVAAVFTNKDIYSNRFYIDGTLQVLSQLKSTPSNEKAVVNANARIGGWRQDNGQRFKSYLDELKIFKGELNATTIANIYNSEKNLQRTVTCTHAIFNAVNRNGGCFNWDNNITTKIAGAPIELTILAADQEQNSSITDVNITNLELLSFSDAACNTLYDIHELWNGNEAVDTEGCFNPTAFTHNKAIKCARIKITGLYAGSTVEANSSDTFSIRPDRFSLESTPTGKLTAEESYTFQAKAVNHNGSTTADYNQSVTPQSHKYFRDDSDGSTMDGAFKPDTAFTFSDGITADTTLSFDNVGKVGLELNDTVWAEVDSDDTPLKERTIYLEHNLTFIPDRFEIAFDATPSMDNHGRSFTYYANDLANMGADLKNLDFKITAVGKNGTTMTNYHDDAKYYANPIALSTALTIDQNPNITAENITQLGFEHGVDSIAYATRHFNYGRERNVTKAPMTIDGANSDINISVVDTIDHEVNGTKEQTFDGNATFYYGRVRAEDIKTGQTSVDAKVRVQIFSPSPLAGFEQESLSWYLNKLDSFTIVGNRAEEKRKLTDTTVSNHTMSNGTQSFTITANPTDRSYKKFYHLSIPAWLWYSKYEDYDFTTGSGCIAHPCFGYIYTAPGDAHGITSGDFKGATFDHNFTAQPQRKAVKLLR